MGLASPRQKEIGRSFFFRNKNHLKGHYFVAYFKFHLSIKILSEPPVSQHLSYNSKCIDSNKLTLDTIEVPTQILISEFISKYLRPA